MKRILLVLATFVIFIPLSQTASAVGFQWPDVWHIDMNDQLRELDPTTGAWHPRQSNALAAEGSYYNNGSFEATFYVNKDNEIYQWTSGWTQQYGATAVDVASGGGEAFVVTASGYVYKQQPWGLFDWIPQIPGSADARRIDVDENGVPWVVFGGSALYTQQNGQWVEIDTILVPGNPMSKLYPADIAANAGMVIMVAANKIGAYGLYSYENGTWVSVGGSFTRVDIDRAGNIWAVGSTTFDLWLKAPGSANFQRVITPAPVLDVGA